jgi:hypothetical protein
MDHKPFKRCIPAVMALLAFSPAPAVRAEVSADTLLDEMADLGRLASLPDPAYVTKQFSSYDRASTTHSDQQGWFANADCGQYLRVEEKAGRKERVMMDAAGPGAIVRIWSANPAGTLRVYLDGSEKPAIEAPLATVLGGKLPGLPVPLAGERARGWNLYFPIPYAGSCKVTSDAGDFYYHIGYRTYPAGTEVKTFAAADLTRLSSKIAATAARLAKPRDGGGLPADLQKAAFEARLHPDEDTVLWKAEGPRSVCELSVRIDAANLKSAARGLVLRMAFDGQWTVESPLGDFFGTAPGLIPYESVPLGMTGDGEMWCRFRMPFAKSAEIRLRNLSAQEATVRGAVSSVPAKFDDKTLLFHAKWRIEKSLPTRPMTDWRHLAANGAGRFVGGSLHLVSPVKIWWGEGDEKIYVDGETFPSHFGTGTEDYYGYAWGSSERFVHAYHNQPRVDGPGNYGNTSVNRFHLFDDIPFTRSLVFDVENWHWDPNCDTERDAVSYWYARPGGTDFFGPVTRDDVAYVEVPPWQPRSVAGAIECEGLRVAAKTGEVSTQDYDFMSGEKHLWWSKAKPGEKLTLAFEVPEARKARLLVRCTKAKDYAKVQFHVGGAKAGSVVDLYDPNVVPSPEIDLGEVSLSKGENTITVEIVGANEKAEKAYMVGLDYVKLK